MAGARTRFGARRSGLSRWRASASLAMAEDCRAGVADEEQHSTVRREGGRRELLVAGWAADLKKREKIKEGKRADGPSREKKEKRIRGGREMEEKKGEK